MVNVVGALLLLLPFPLMAVLALSRSVRRRRAAYYTYVMTALMSYGFIAFVGWVVPRLAEDGPPLTRDLPASLFAEPLRTFFGSGWLMAAYLLILVLGGYFAYRRAGGRKVFV